MTFTALLQKHTALLLTVAVVLLGFQTRAQTITTIAGGIGNDSAAAIYGRVSQPQSVAADGGGNIYIAETYMIRRVNPSGNIKPISNISPAKVAVDRLGRLYASANNSVYRVDTATGALSVVAGTGVSGFSGDGGAATAARLTAPEGIAIDSAGNIYIADQGNVRIRKVNTAGIISSIAGGGYLLGDGGPATNAQINPIGIAVDRFGNVYITDVNRVRKINSAGIITTYAGTGVNTVYSGDGGLATAAIIPQPQDVKADSLGNVYICIFTCNYVLKVNTSGIIKSIAGNGTNGFTGDGGAATIAQLDEPRGIALDAAGNIFIADYLNNRVRIVTASGVINTFAGNGIAISERFGGDGRNALLANFEAIGLAFDTAGQLIVADFGNSRIRKIDHAGVITTIAGTGISGYTGEGWPATVSDLGQVWGVAADRMGNIYIADYGSARVRRVNAAGIINTVAGGGSGLGDGGPATAAIISAYSVAVDSAGNIYIADGAQRRIRKVNVSTGIITTVAGNGVSGHSGDGGPATAANIGVTNAICLDKYGNIYISDSFLRKIDTNGIITTINATAYNSLVADRAGNVYGCPVSRNAVSRVDIYNYASVVAGNGIAGYWGDNGAATAAELKQPYGLAIDTAGNLYVADALNFAVRKICCLGSVIDHPPVFTHGSSQILATCTSSGPASIDTFLKMTDAEPGSTETWTITAPPLHGTVTGLPYAATFTGTAISPVGITFTPDSGYSGTDRFIIRISDGTDTVITQVNVTINPLPAAGSISGAASVCTGAITGLSESLAGGAWSSSNSTATIGSTGVVTAVAVGTDTIFYTITTACGTAVASHIIAINPLPVGGTITGLATVCVAASIALADGSGSGTWSSSDPYVSVGRTSGVVAGIAPGPATISYVVSNSCGATIATKTLTVNARATAGSITGATTLCTGGAVTLSDAVSGGVWSSGATAVAAIGSGTGVVTGIAVGGAVISYTVNNGCSSATAITFADVIAATPIDPITGASSICSGTTTALSDATSGGAWSSGNTAVAAIGSTGVVTGVAAGVAAISYTGSLGCGISVAMFNITVVTSPSSGVISGTVSLCEGTDDLLESGVAGGAWSAGNSHATVGPTGIVTGISTGIDTITYTVSNSCGTASATHTLTVYAGPAPGAISGASSLCAGATSTLTDATSGGVWSSSAPAVAAAGSAGVVTGISGGTASISYTVTTGCGIAAATRVVTVTAPSAGLIMGVTTLCAGGATTLSDAVSGGTWSSSATSVATIGSAGAVTAIAPGVSIISYTVSGACGAATSTAIFTVGSLPIVSPVAGPAYVCAGSAAAFTDGTSSGVWSSGNTSVATIGSTGTVTGVAAGTASISYMVTAGCGAASSVANITVYTLPSAGTVSGASSVCAGAATTFTDGVSGGIWHSGATAIALVGTAGAVTGVAQGTAVISYTVDNGCGIAYATRSITVNTVSAGIITGLTTVCVAASATLADAISGGTWSSSTTTVAAIGSATGIVTGVAGGISIVSYTVTNGCGAAIATTIINVNTPPVVAPISGAATLCAATTTPLTDGSSGGVWSSANTSVATIGSSGTVTGIAAGASTISYIIAAGCGLAGSTLVVHVETLPPAGTISGSRWVCEGATAALTESAAGGTWSSSNAAKAPVSTSGMVTGLDTGIVAISYTISNSCGDAVASITDTVKGLAWPGVITGSVEICQGAVAAVSDAVPGGVWSSGNPSVATIGTAGSVTGVAPGCAEISYTITNSCGAGSAAANVTINPLPYMEPIYGFTTLAAGSVSLLIDPIAGGAWSSSNPAVGAVDSAGIITGVAAGTTIITYTLMNSFGCSADTTLLVTVREPSGIQELSAGNRYRLYPNPATNEITIAWENQAVHKGDIVFTDAAGRVIYATEVAMPTASGNKSISLDNWAPGVYFVTITTTGGSYTGKLVIAE